MTSIVKRTKQRDLFVVVVFDNAIRVPIMVDTVVVFLVVYRNNISYKTRHVQYVFHANRTGFAAVYRTVEIYYSNAFSFNVYSFTY